MAWRSPRYRRVYRQRDGASECGVRRGGSGGEGLNRRTRLAKEAGRGNAEWEGADEGGEFKRFPGVAGSG